MKSISTRIAQVALFLATASFAFNTGAAPAVKIDGVRQNFPWSNAVEIGYSVTDCETGSANDYVLRFVVTKGGETTDITAAVGAPLVTNTAAGKVVWDAPADFASTPADVTLSVSVVDTPFDGDLSKLVGDYEVRDGQTLFGTLAGSYKLTIADGATVTLSNAVVTNLADDARFAGLTCLGDATIVLAGSDTNIVNGADNSPGIFVPTNHTLTIQGDGALVTTGGDYGAGIGSGQNSDCGNITISGGTVIANGGMAAAGIGSGYNGSTCGNVTISGGTVIATGGYEGAGIGSGFNHSTCGGITIGAGIVKVVATGGGNGAESIGKGVFGSCGTVTINPETVERTDGDTRTILPKTVDLSTLTAGYEAQNGQTLTGTLAGSYKITIAAGATVTLSNAVVASLAYDAGCAGLTCLGDATIVLAGSDTNVVNGARFYPGIFVPTNCTLTIQGDGALAATGGDAAAGIGSAFSSSGGNITISSGTVEAKGGEGGAGIGGGYYSSCGNIVIGSGIVKVVATKGSSDAESIGKGHGSTCGTVTVDPETLERIDGDTRTIWPKTLDLAKLSAGYEAQNGQTLTGALAGSYPITIAAGATVTLSNAVVASLASDAGCAGLTCLGDATIVLAGGDANVVNGAEYNPGIFVPTNCTLTIQGDGALAATGGQFGAGIGSSYYQSSCGDITVSGGTVVATGGDSAAGIGSGFNSSSCGDIAISGGTVVATGGENAAGIGSGFHSSSCGDITILGGMVEAKGGKYAAGIGSGYVSGRCGIITISGGTVEATGGDSAAGIGSGFSWSTSGDITIGSDIVKVVVKGGGIIGAGSSSSCGTVTIDPETIEQTDGDTRTIWPKTLDLAKLTAGYEAQNGQTLTGTLAGSHQLTIAAGATVTLSNAVVSTDLTCLGDATLVLAGSDTNIVNGARYNPGIFVPSGSTLTIQGDGALAATGGDYGAGIGSGYNGSTCGDIAITGGSVIANGGYGGAGIGSGGMNSRCGDITISGGTVIATGGDYAAGIGSGYANGTCGDIAIGAGIVKVVATRGSNAESIGSGYFVSSCGTVTIDPETIDQTDGDTRTIWPKTLDLAKLTAGYEAQNGQTLTGTLAGSHQLTIADGATVTLSNAVVSTGLTCLGDATLVLAGSDTNIVNGARYNPGIFVPSGSTLTIQGDGALAATGGGDFAAGIGSAGSGSSCRTCGNIAVSGGTVIATGGDHAAGIGSSNYATCGDITISGGSVVATGGNKAAGIGSSFHATCGYISISGGTVVATGGQSAAGIGSGHDGSVCSNITISGGMVVATGDNQFGGGAGIGSGCDGSRCGTITISGGTVIATGGQNGAGIGSGSSGSTCGTITISGGTVEATAGYAAAGIGSGSGVNSSCGDIAIGAGIVKVVASGQGHGGENIGKGSDGSCGTVTVDPELEDESSSTTRTIQAKRLDLSTVTGDCVVKDGWTIFGTLAGSHKISIANVPAGATVTLSNAVIASLANNAGFAGITCLGDTTIILAGSDTNIVKGASNNPGIFVPVGRTLTIQGDGTLAATGSQYAAGIGSGFDGSNCGNISISGGTVVATGGQKAAGIGGGFYNSTCGNITISGGTVVANGGSGGAGIGSGNSGSTCGNITISGGTVVATGGYQGAGIGGGFSNSDCGDISISGGTVVATGGFGAAGIGSGYYMSDCGDISISGGTVNAEGGEKAAGIGSGYSSTCSDITIGAGIVKIVATRGGSNAESIGKGFGGSCGTVTVDSETVERTDGDTRTIWAKTVDLSTLAAAYEAQNGQTLSGTLAGSHQITIAAGATVTLSNAVVASLANDAGFAGLTCLGDATIILAGSDTNIVNGTYDNPGIFVPAGRTLTIQGDGALAATGGKYGAGIGSGSDGSRCGDIKISGGTVIATGGECAAGIGSGYDNSNCGNITISGGTVEATGGKNAAGIGCGFESSCGDITISGGSVVATGGEKAAGIGSGFSGSTCGDITISGGTVAATGGDFAAGIGSGYSNSDCGDIAISGGTVEATGGNQAAGIGSGLTSSCGAIEISGGTIEAKGGKDAAGIGSGYASSCSGITIGAGIVKVVATRGNSDAESIGKGFGGTCGTVTIADEASPRVTQN